MESFAYAQGVRLTRRRLLQAAGLSMFAEPSFAENFPAKPVHIIVPQPPGGAADRVARIFAERLESRWRQSVIVENKPGGGVVVGTLATARATPDGHTFALLGSSLSINAVQRKDLPYDVLNDLQPLARIGYYTMVLVATASFPANDIPSLIALAKQQPGRLAYGSNGIGTSAEVAGEMLCHMAGVKMQHVPYNGASKMYTDMVGSQIPLGFSVASSAEPFIKAGQLKVLGVTSMHRSSLFPGWPSIAETYPGFDVVNWAGFVSPSKLPTELMQKLSVDLLNIAAEPVTVKKLATLGIEMAPAGPQELARFLHSEIERFGTAIRSQAPAK